LATAKNRVYLYFGIALLAVFALGCLAGYLGSHLFSPPRQHYELRQAGYKFIRPLLECDYAYNAPENRGLRSFEENIGHNVKTILEKKWASDISVYFRELNDGPWFSIGPVDNYAPASLMKVPSMVSILKQAEKNPDLLQKKIVFDSQDDLTSLQQIRPSKTLRQGESYTLEELVRRMIVYSDNNAAQLVENETDPGVLKELFHDIGIRSPYTLKPENYISVKNYSSIFRVLYNASYLNREMSEKAMTYLAESEFRDGIVYGVRPDISVAHKFGEWESGEHKEIKQLHDCGIVYYPDHPYLLCVMTRGTSLQYLDDAIRKISHAVFQGVDQQHKARGGNN